MVAWHAVNVPVTLPGQSEILPGKAAAVGIKGQAATIAAAQCQQRRMVHLQPKKQLQQSSLLS
jgi:hypothetical protein